MAMTTKGNEQKTRTYKYLLEKQTQKAGRQQQKTDKHKSDNKTTNTVTHSQTKNEVANRHSGYIDDGNSPPKGTLARHIDRTDILRGDANYNHKEPGTRKTLRRGREHRKNQ